MNRTIADVFDLPSREELTALAFVVQIREDAPNEGTAGGGEIARLVRDYVVTPTVATELPIILKAMKHTLERREDFGRFVHGSFGSGKSHFMAFLGLLLENDARVWKKDDTVVKALAEHRAWLETSHLLVVRLHMLTAGGGQEMGLDRAVYEATNAALARRGKAPFEFLHVEGVLEEAKREAELFGAAFWTRLNEAGIVGSREDFDALAKGSLEDREGLARAYLQWKGRDAATAGVDPAWATGLRKLTDHVKEQGYGGLVLMVDEFLLWLREKDKHAFERAINQLNVMVDHADGARSLPLFVFVARQRNIEEFFPDLVEEKLLHEHLGHHSKRFEKTDLEDVELRFVCKGRVLRVRPGFEAEVDAVRANLADRQKKVLPSVLQTAGIDYLKDVYPFHPALIEMLVDVSALMQRDRTALRLLYELLVVQHPRLPLGALLPVGAAFDALFPEAGIEGSKKVDELRAIHRSYHQQFKRAMDEMRKNVPEFDEARRHVLDLIVKTVLLCVVSPRLKGTTAPTIERLVRLNDAEIEGETERSKTSRVFSDLSELARLVPGVLTISGQGAQATVSVVLSKVNFGEILSRARSEISGQKNVLLSAFYGVLLPALKLDRDELNTAKTVEWRKTRRKAFLAVRNIRELQNADFKVQAGEDVRILIDYPWDEPGYGPGDDEQRALDVKRRDGASLTICWLPRHLTENEKSLIEDLAALDHLLGADQDKFVSDLAPHERTSVRDQASSQQQNLRLNLTSKLGEIYRDSGRLIALREGVGTKVPGGELSEVLDGLTGRLLDFHYAHHPNFRAEPKAEALSLVCAFAARAIGGTDHGTEFTEDEAKALRTLAEPLELVTLGQSRGTLRLDTRYIKTVRDEAKGDSVMWDAIDRKLSETYGLPLVVRNFFLRLLLSLESFRAVQAVSGEELGDLPIDGKARSNIKLLRAPLLDLAEWSRARELGRDLLKVDVPHTTRTLSAQDQLGRSLRTAAQTARVQLQGAFEHLARLQLNESARASEVRDAMSRLAPLVRDSNDSCAMIREWAAVWPGDSSDPVRLVVVRAATIADGLTALEDHARTQLAKAPPDALNGEVATHLAKLNGLLGDREQERKLDRKATQAWNEAAHGLVGRLLDAVSAATAPVAATATATATSQRAPTPPPAAGSVRIQKHATVGDREALEAIWADVLAQAAAVGPDAELTIDVIISPKTS